MRNASPPATSSTVVVVLPAPLPPPTMMAEASSITAAAWSTRACRSARIASTVIPAISMFTAASELDTVDQGAIVLGHGDPGVLPDVEAVGRRRPRRRMGGEQRSDHLDEVGAVAAHLDRHAERVHGPVLDHGIRRRRKPTGP